MKHFGYELTKHVVKLVTSKGIAGVKFAIFLCCGVTEKYWTGYCQCSGDIVTILPLFVDII